MKSYFFFIIGGIIALTMDEFLFKSNPKATNNHPQIKSIKDVYQIPLTDSVSDVCYDSRSKTVVIVEGIFIQSRCPIDSNRWHFNIKTK